MWRSLLIWSLAGCTGAQSSQQPPAPSDSTSILSHSVDRPAIQLPPVRADSPGQAVRVFLSIQVHDGSTSVTVPQIDIFRSGALSQGEIAAILSSIDVTEWPDTERPVPWHPLFTQSISNDIDYRYKLSLMLDTMPADRWYALHIAALPPWAFVGSFRTLYPTSNGYISRFRTGSAPSALAVSLCAKNDNRLALIVYFSEAVIEESAALAEPTSGQVANLFDNVSGVAVPSDSVIMDDSIYMLLDASTVPEKLLVRLSSRLVSSTSGLGLLEPIDLALDTTLLRSKQDEQQCSYVSL